MEQERKPGMTPPFFRKLAAKGYLAEEDIRSAGDGFYAAAKSMADILAVGGVITFPDSRDRERQCGRFFDDWYLDAVPGEGGYTYSLYKMREQEHDAEEGVAADGDTPGVTVSFIAFRTEVLEACLAEPCFENRKALGLEIDRVVAARGQRHSEALKAYFRRPQAEGPYLIAELYVRFLASLVREGSLAVPRAYAALRDRDRLPRFIRENNLSAGETVCDGERIFIRDPQRLTLWEKNALLATHTADVSVHAFAAEVRYHACFLFGLARIPIPFLGRSVYDSAIRADMTIGESELEGPAPFHREGSRWIRLQQKYHPLTAPAPQWYV